MGAGVGIGAAKRGCMGALLSCENVAGTTVAVCDLPNSFKFGPTVLPGTVQVGIRLFQKVPKILPVHLLVGL